MISKALGVMAAFSWHRMHAIKFRDLCSYPSITISSDDIKEVITESNVDLTLKEKLQHEIAV